jgi:nucleoside-diphosphate-sugar epimerase
MGVYALHVDVAHAAASIPGTGDDLVSFSYSRDVARFVEAVVGMKRWEREEMSCYSDVCSLNEVVRLAEEVRGESLCFFFLFFFFPFRCLLFVGL